MQELKFLNTRNEEITFDLNPPYIFWKISGLELPNVNTITTQAPGQHGSSLHQILLESRIIKLVGHVHGKNSVKLMYEERKRLNNICNPLLGLGVVEYKNDFGGWRIGAFCRSDIYEDKIREVQTLTITFECPVPFWQDLEETGVYFAYIEGGLEFPLETPSEFGTLGYKVEINNDSDVDVPIEMFMEGGAVNPIITNISTGEFIKLSKDLHKAFELYINTDPENMEVAILSKDVETNEQISENAYGYLTDDSTLFKLKPGMNELIFDSDDENKVVKIRIYFRKRYLGV